MLDRRRHVEIDNEAAYLNEADFGQCASRYGLFLFDS